ncbi:hypothetical protein JH06_0317 [Blastocystis sp. subtype 4]|uniref:hypothetical protein n=1 Tax=Blastocystis sp. subtype 4 TaxID=944170 RepID=UPI0007114C8A|nr:hypothetical protein JH06_0317 [Blastocystis sp. subtype 4]KNB46190.1 hypothetical protein JH06_0317 [Blastocystis sp. subtype 4]|eukprot:XP_014529633.1 hypothetical protein JH06_0317 [Blastocystis sp. subtype 4]
MNELNFLKTRRIVPFSDTQGLSPSPRSTKKRKEQALDASPKDDSFEMIDVEKEVQNLFTDPVTHLRSLQPMTSPQQIENITSDLQNSIDEFRSFISSNIVSIYYNSRLSEQISQSFTKSSSSNSQSASSDPIVEKETKDDSIERILKIVTQNNQMLTTLSSEPKQEKSSDALRTEMNQLRATLEAESAKCKKLLTLLDDTIHENDIMGEDLESMRVELSKRISSEIEYTVLYNGMKESVEQSEAAMLEYRDHCEKLEEKVQELEKRLQYLQKPMPECEEDEVSLPEETVEIKQESDVKKLQSMVNTYLFTNQTLIQQVAEWRTRYLQNSNKEWKSEMEKRIHSLEEENSTLKKENEEMRGLLSKTDLTDYQYIEDSSSLAD